MHRPLEFSESGTTFPHTTATPPTLASAVPTKENNPSSSLEELGSNEELTSSASDDDLFQNTNHPADILTESSSSDESNIWVHFLFFIDHARLCYLFLAINNFVFALWDVDALPTKQWLRVWGECMMSSLLRNSRRKPASLENQSSCVVWIWAVLQSSGARNIWRREVGTIPWRSMSVHTSRWILSAKTLHTSMEARWGSIRLYPDMHTGHSRLTS